MKQIIVFTLMLLTFLGLNAQIKWTSFAEVTEQKKVEEKKVMIKIYSEECVWCKRMEEKTFNESGVVNYINTHFQAIELDVAHKGQILFNDKTYQAVKKGGKTYHELAMEMTRGNLSFPAIVFLDENMNIIQAISGFKEPELFLKIMTYFAQNHYKRTPWSEYQELNANVNKGY